MQTSQNVLKLLGQYPKATKSLLVVGIIGVLGLTNLKLNSETKTVQSSLDFEVPTVLESKTEKAKIKTESKFDRIDRLEQRLLELENGLTQLGNRVDRKLGVLNPENGQPQSNMEIFAVKLCKHHGGNSSNSEVNPCLETEYFKRQAEALKPFYEKQINNCLSVGKGNACLDPKTYQEDKKESPLGTNRIANPILHSRAHSARENSSRNQKSDDISIGICQLIFNPERCK